MAISVRRGLPPDLKAVVAIQDASGELSPWSSDSLARVLDGDPGYGLLVAGSAGRVAAFLLWRELPARETEVLGLAVEPSSRRKGLARALLDELLRNRPGNCFLEVRASNFPAQRLYSKLGFVRCGLRRAYYHHPVEDALVMRRPEIPPKDATQTH